MHQRHGSRDLRVRGDACGSDARGVVMRSANEAHHAVGLGKDSGSGQVPRVMHIICAALSSMAVGHSAGL